MVAIFVAMVVNSRSIRRQTLSRCLGAGASASRAATVSCGRRLPRDKSDGASRARSRNSKLQAKHTTTGLTFDQGFLGGALTEPMAAMFIRRMPLTPTERTRRVAKKAKAKLSDEG